MIKSRLCDDLGIEYPVFQGGMAWIADARLAGAVSEAGGLGIIASMDMDGESVRKEIRACRAITDRPFGVNVMLTNPHAADVADVVVEEGVPVVTTGAGNPVTYIRRWTDVGIRVIPVVSSVALARMAAKRGAYAVIAEGGESGGHIGELSTMVLVREVCEAVDIPVVAAGGIADGRGMAAALMLGACGVQMGTAFLVADECGVHENYKEMVLKAGDRDTLVTGRRAGHPARALKNAFSRSFRDRENDMSFSAEELERYGMDSLRRAAKDGDTETGSFFCGEIAGLVNERKSVSEIVRGVCSEAERVLRCAPDLIA